MCGAGGLHFLWRYGHPRSHHIQRISQHGCCGASHRSSQEPWKWWEGSGIQNINIYQLLTSFITTKYFDLTVFNLKRNNYQTRSITLIRHLLALKTIVSSQQLLVLLMCTELDGSIWDDSHHGGRVAPPQTEEAILQVRAID